MSWQPGQTLKDVERNTIKEAHRYYRGNNQQTATALGIGVRTLYDKLKEYEADEIRRKDEAYERRQADAAFLERQRNGTNAKLPTDQVELPTNSDEFPTDVDVGSLDTSDIPPIEPDPGNGSARPTADEGLSEKPAADDTAQQPVSLSKRKEVQAVLPRQALAGGQRRRG